jgi:putative hydrolase of the HAD superfamily
MQQLGRLFLRRALSRVPSDSTLESFLESYLAEWSKGVRYPAGTAELLGRLARRFRLAVVTNTHDTPFVLAHMRALGASPHVQAVVTSVDFGLRKPHPAIFRHALELLGAEAGRCVHVGDSFAADYCGAQGAGIAALLIDPTGSAPVPDRDRIRSVQDVESSLPAGP